MNLRSDIEFLLYEWLRIDSLLERPRFTEHSRESFSAVMDVCERVAREKFAPSNRRADLEEPLFDGTTVRLPESTVSAVRAQLETGIVAAAQDYADGGLQLPCSVQMACQAFFAKASIAINSYAGLTRGNANLLMTHGTAAQKRVFAMNEFAGRWLGTMCLSEPHAGSSLADITTRACPDGDDHANDPLGPRYRLKGNKMWISAGDHEITENIVHLVLARTPMADGTFAPGVKGISLFIVPKRLVSIDAELTGERNDVALAGLNHKLGYRGTTNTLLNFGEGSFPVRGSAGAIGYLVGAPGDGLRCMFHMMNEARVNVGLGATMLGYAGYEASLAYACSRRQGRHVGRGDPTSGHAQVNIIEHADVKRMLLAQKAYVEGAMALVLYCARLLDEQRTGSEAQAREASWLLQVLTPIVKSWPSEFCLEANSFAIQVHGGCGYTRDFPVEQYWRDNRLNMIHEGTHGIQARDLLGRKVRMDDGEGLRLLAQRISKTIECAREQSVLASHSIALTDALNRLLVATQAAWATSEPEHALANATPYLQAFGHVVLSWIWLDVGLICLGRLEADGTSDVVQGKLAAMRYFFHYELPRIDAWLRVVEQRDSTCLDTEDAWF